MKRLLVFLAISVCLSHSNGDLAAQSASLSPFVPRNETTNDGAVRQDPTDRIASRPDAASIPAPSNSNIESFEPGRILAVVGGHPIFVSDMSLEMSQIFQQLMPGAPQNVIESQRPILIEKLLPKYIDSKLLYVDVIGGLPPEADLDEIFKQASDQFDEHLLPYLKEQANVKSSAELDAKFRAQGSSLRLMRKSWSENELVKYLTKQKINSEPEVTREELLQFYQDHKSDFAIEAKAKWEQVMIRFNRFETREQARNELAKLGNKIVNGASFEAAARNHSHGINADQGGKHDWTVQGSLVSKQLDQAIFSLPLNELSDIIESDVGFHIIRVTGRHDAGFLPFLDAQSEIREKIEEEKREAEFQKHLAKLRETIPVDILIEK